MLILPLIHSDRYKTIFVFQIPHLFYELFCDDSGRPPRYYQNYYLNLLQMAQYDELL